jgi:hypothetical protein
MPVVAVTFISAGTPPTQCSIDKTDLPQTLQCLARAGRCRPQVLHSLRLFVTSSYGVRSQCATLALLTKPGSLTLAARNAARHSASTPVPVYLSQACSWCEQLWLLGHTRRGATASKRLTCARRGRPASAAAQTRARGTSCTCTGTTMLSEGVCSKRQAAGL